MPVKMSWDTSANNRHSWCVKKTVSEHISPLSHSPDHDNIYYHSLSYMSYFNMSGLHEKEMNEIPKGKHPRVLFLSFLYTSRVFHSVFWHPSNDGNILLEQTPLRLDSVADLKWGAPMIRLLSDKWISIEEHLKEGSQLSFTSFCATKATP